MNAIKSQDAAIYPFPHLLIVHVAGLNCSPKSVDELWICDRDLDIWTLRVPLKAEEILSHDQLDRMYGGRMLGQLRFEICFEGSAIVLAK